MTDGPLQPRKRVADRLAAERERQDHEEEAKAQRMRDAEQRSLNDPARPEVLHLDSPPDEITIRIITHAGNAVLAEAGGQGTSMNLESGDAGAVLAGAETALAALGYTLDRFRLYQDMALMVGRFHREPPAGKVCIGCDSPQGQPHEKWCPVVTGTLSSLPEV